MIDRRGFLAAVLMVPGLPRPTVKQSRRDVTISIGHARLGVVTSACDIHGHDHMDARTGRWSAGR